VKQVGATTVVKFFLAIFVTFACCTVTLADSMTLKAQHLLNELGYNAGVPDGLYGSRTALALRDFYRSKGQNFGGSLGAEEVLELLKTARQISGIQETSAPPSKPIFQCRILAKPDLVGLNLDSDKFISLIHFYSKNLKAFKRVNTASDRQDQSSKRETDIIDQIQSTTLQFQTSFFQYPTNKRAQDLVRVIDSLFDTGFLSELRNNDDDPRYQYGHFLAIILHSYDALQKRGMLSEAQEQKMRSEIQRRFVYFETIGDTKWFRLAKCGPEASIGCNANHWYFEHYLRTLYGYVFDDIEHFLAGEEVFKFALDDAKHDIGLWREASRGWWSWAYYGLGMTDLAGIAEIYRRIGIDLYSYQSTVSGLTYHDLVSRFVDAIEDPELMYVYSKKGQGLVGRQSSHKNPLIYNKTVGTLHPERSNWYYLYKGRFPNKPSITKYEKRVRSLKYLSKYHWNIGFNPQCAHAELVSDNPTKNESAVRFDFFKDTEFNVRGTQFESNNSSFLMPYLSNISISQLKAPKAEPTNDHNEILKISANLHLNLSLEYQAVITSLLPKAIFEFSSLISLMERDDGVSQKTKTIGIATGHFPGSEAIFNANKIANKKCRSLPRDLHKKNSFEWVFIVTETTNMKIKQQQDCVLKEFENQTAEVEKFYKAFILTAPHLEKYSRTFLN
jgi:peptidoglycan hydrolase-like protein with peptidoglycan-binding domain